MSAAPSVGKKGFTSRCVDVQREVSDEYYSRSDEDRYSDQRYRTVGDEEQESDKNRLKVP